MARRESLGEQFRDIIGKRIQLVARKTALEALRNAAVELCDTFIKAANVAGMSMITGNAYRSFTVGIYEDGKLLEYITTEDDNPTMKTLKKGQAYPLPYYYDGTPVMTRYVGNVGSGGQWGPSLGPSRIRSMRPNSRAKWNFLVIIPVEYAPFREFNHIHDTMTVLQDLLPGMFAGSVMKVKREGYIKTISSFKKYT